MLRVIVFSSFLFLTSFSQAQTIVENQPKYQVQQSLLVDDFVAALDHFQRGTDPDSLQGAQSLWVRAFKARKLKTSFVDKRLRKAKMGSYKLGGSDPLAKFRQITVETYAELPSDKAAIPTALHAFRIDVEEDYDDFFNDDIYCYFITTHDDLVWGKVTSIYRGIDEHQSFFLSAEDRGLFGPNGEKLTPRNHLIVDFGIVESDGGDIRQLQQLSQAIVDLALVALTLYDPNAGTAAAQARAETNNLLNLIISMDSDDRLVTDTVRLTPDSLDEMLAQQNQSFHEFNRFYERETFWTHFAYRIHFRAIR